MGEGHYRVLMLGEGALVDRAAADLVADGMAVVQVSTSATAQHMLDRGDFDVVIVGAAEAAGMAGLYRRGAKPPWMVLQPTDVPRLAAFAGAEVVALPVTGSQLLALLDDVVTQARPQKARVAGNVSRSSALSSDNAKQSLATHVGTASERPDAGAEGPKATV